MHAVLYDGSATNARSEEGRREEASVSHVGEIHVKRVVVVGNKRERGALRVSRAAAAATRHATLSRFPSKTCRRGDRAGTHCPRLRLINAHFSPFISSRTTSPGPIVGTSRGGPSGGGGAPGRPPSSETSDSPEVIPSRGVSCASSDSRGADEHDATTRRCARVRAKTSARRRVCASRRVVVVSSAREHHQVHLVEGANQVLDEWSDVARRRKRRLPTARTPRASRGTPAPSTRARTDPPSAVCARCAPLRETRSRARVRAGTAR